MSLLLDLRHHEQPKSPLYLIDITQYNDDGDDDDAILEIKPRALALNHVPALVFCLEIRSC